MVEDDWARGMDPDLLHVAFDGSRVTVEELLAKVAGEGFEARAKPNE